MPCVKNVDLQFMYTRISLLIKNTSLPNCEFFFLIRLIKDNYFVNITKSFNAVTSLQKLKHNQFGITNSLNQT
jgi:hypothetical protein